LLVEMSEELFEVFGGHVYVFEDSLAELELGDYSVVICVHLHE